MKEEKANVKEWEKKRKHYEGESNNVESYKDWA